MRFRLGHCSIGLTVVLAAGCDSSGSVYPAPNPPPASSGLWTVSARAAALPRPPPSPLGPPGALAPATTPTTPGAQLSTLVGLAFDAGGDLWVASQDDSLLIELASAGLTGSGSAPARAGSRPRARPAPGAAPP